MRVGGVWGACGGRAGGVRGRAGGVGRACGGVWGRGGVSGTSWGMLLSAI